MAVKGLDTLLAIKVINLVPGLCQSDRRVGVTLIEHFNRRTGRCDPGLERIAGLLGICTRTVIRSTQRLQTSGLFLKVRHGGWSNRNSYEPNWSRFAKLDAAWKEKLHKKSLSRRTNLSPATGKSCHLPGDSGVTQTCRDNLHKQTCSIGHPNEAKGQLVNRRSLIPISDQVKPGNAAHAAAERRWTDALHRRFASSPITYAEVIDAIDASMQIAATEAEMRSRGAGLVYILTKLKIPDGR